jgi:hypothetical protein
MLSARVGSFVACLLPKVYSPALSAGGTPQSGLVAAANAKPGTPCKRARLAATEAWARFAP